MEKISEFALPPGIPDDAPLQLRTDLLMQEFRMRDTESYAFGDSGDALQFCKWFYDILTEWMALPHPDLHALLGEAQYCPICNKVIRNGKSSQDTADA